MLGTEAKSAELSCLVQTTISIDLGRDRQLATAGQVHALTNIGPDYVSVSELGGRGQPLTSYHIMTQSQF